MLLLGRSHQPCTWASENRIHKCTPPGQSFLFKLDQMRPWLWAAPLEGSIQVCKAPLTGYSRKRRQGASVLGLPALQGSLRLAGPPGAPQTEDRHLVAGYRKQAKMPGGVLIPLEKRPFCRCVKLWHHVETSEVMTNTKAGTCMHCMHLC